MRSRAEPIQARAAEHDDWAVRELVGLLSAVSSHSDEASLLQGGLEHIAEAIEAEVGAIVQGATVRASVGFPLGQVPVPDLVRVAAQKQATLQVARVGTCHVATAEAGDVPPLVLLVGRRDEPFDQQDNTVLRGAGHVLALATRLTRLLDLERATRRESERTAAENASLLRSLQRRQQVMEQLLAIQQAIARRDPLPVVMDAITAGVAAALEDDIVILRLADPDDPEVAIIRSGLGLPDSYEAHAPIHSGVSGQAMLRDELVVVEDYASDPMAFPEAVDDGMQAAMAAPVHRDGVAVGSVAAATRQEGRRYGKLEQDALRAFAEVATLALNDDAARERIRDAMSSAEHRATHDPLTGLPNRSLVLDRLEQALARSRRSAREVTVLFVDLDRFKRVNDSFGHSVGDEVLMRVAERLLAAVRDSDTVSRLAGDEFVVVCEDLDDTAVLAMAERLTAAIAEPIPLYGRETVITASIGVRRTSGDVVAERVLQDADVAMYRAKETGRDRVEAYDARMHAGIVQRLETERLLRHAAAREELRLHFQPVVRMADGSLAAIEALVRWEHPERGLIGPDQFIEVAEEAGFIVSIDTWVLQEACRQLAAWRLIAPAAQDCRVSVNVSARQFTDPHFVDRVAATLADAGLPPEHLSLEITESVIMDDTARTGATLAALKEMGCWLSVDDFGTGYSSLAYLKRFPVDQLKIDRSFIQGLGSDPADSEIVRAVVGLATGLRIEVVAEGVETDAQLEEVRRAGCHYAQGYLLGRPSTPVALSAPGGLLAAPQPENSSSATITPSPSRATTSS